MELYDIEALASTSTVLFHVYSSGTPIMGTLEREAKKTIVWETTYRVPISSYQTHLELHLLRISQDLLTNQFTRKTLGLVALDFPSVAVIEKGEGKGIDCTASFWPKGKPGKKPVGKLTLGWSYASAPNPYADLDTVR